ncbi:MAG: hypothetical protein ABIQ95_17275 [Bdellovibrionia bacterium]
MSEDEINRAEAEVKKNTQKLETALGHLGETLEDTTLKVAGVIGKVQGKVERTSKKISGVMGTVRETVNKPRRVAQHALEKVQSTAHRSQEVMKHKPLLFWSMVTAAGVSAFVGYYFGRKRLDALVKENQKEFSPIVEEDTIHFLPRVTPNLYKTA